MSVLRDNDGAAGYPSIAELEAGLEHIRRSPRERGSLEMIVRRPASGQREVIEQGELDIVTGLVGDNWGDRRSSRTSDGSPHPDMQLNVMNARAIALLARDRSRWPLAGDQLFVDFDLSEANVPPGTRLAIGSAAIEITPQPHTGCGKFVERFGPASVKFVNSPIGMTLHLRGVNAKVVVPGRIRVGDAVTKRALRIEVRPIRAEETRPLRQSVLRPTQTIGELVFSGDLDPRTIHLGAFVDGRLAGIATIGPSPCPGDEARNAWQLQGMAVVPEAQRSGCGRLLLEHGIRYVADHGGALLWCEGRTGAAAFYKALGFELHGEEFVKPITGPHYIMKLKIENA